MEVVELYNIFFSLKDRKRPTERYHVCCSYFLRYFEIFGGNVFFLYAMSSLS